MISLRIKYSNVVSEIGILPFQNIFIAEIELVMKESMWVDENIFPINKYVTGIFLI